MKCSVISCKNEVKFKFPLNEIMKRKWVKTIGRSTFVPHTRDDLCIAHFNPKDIITESYKSGYKLQSVRLKSGTVPIEVAEKEVEEKSREPQLILTEGDLLLPPSKFMQQLDSDMEAKSTEKIIEASVQKNPYPTQYSKEYLLDTNSDYEAKESLNVTKVPDEDLCSTVSDCCNSSTVKQNTMDQSDTQ